MTRTQSEPASSETGSLFDDIQSRTLARGHPYSPPDVVSDLPDFLPPELLLDDEDEELVSGPVLT